MRRIALIHMSFCPIPQRVEFGFFIQLQRNHHAVRHTFRSHIIAVDIVDIGFGALAVLAIGEIHRLSFGIAIKKVRKSVGNFAVDGGVTFA